MGFIEKKIRKYISIGLYLIGGISCELCFNFNSLILGNFWQFCMRKSWDIVGEIR